jgi:transcriptional regulator with XRE-family HTH domain
VPRKNRSTKDKALAEAFGRQVRAARERLGVSQEKLAFIAGFHRTYVGNLERGEVNPSLYNVVRIATALDVDAADLVRDLPLVDLPPSPLIR